MENEVESFEPYVCNQELENAVTGRLIFYLWNDIFIIFFVQYKMIFSEMQYYMPSFVSFFVHYKKHN